jgi:hypothetical protein
VAEAGNGDGWLVAWALIRANAVDAAAVSITAGSGTVGVGVGSPPPQAASIRLAANKIPPTSFLDTKVTNNLPYPGGS